MDDGGGVTFHDGDYGVGGAEVYSYNFFRHIEGGFCGFVWEGGKCKVCARGLGLCHSVSGFVYLLKGRVSCRSCSCCALMILTAAILSP